MNQILLFIGLVIILCLTIKPVGKNSPSPPCSSLSRSACCWASTARRISTFSDYALTETVCSTALLFIMFYGGFNTNIDRAKPVAVPAVLLSTLGVVITAGITRCSPASRWGSTGLTACCWDRSWHPPTRPASLACCASTTCR